MRAFPSLSVLLAGGCVADLASGMTFLQCCPSLSRRMAVSTVEPRP